MFYQGVIVPISVPLPKKRKMNIISQSFSKKLENLDQILEQTPGFRRLATYIMVKCRK
jgi:hypothetical protein